MLKSGPKRKPTQRDKDLQITAELYLAGRNQYEIAEIIGVSQGTISNDLKAIRVMWRERAVIAFSERKAEELARLDKLEREYWQAWERSIKPAKSKSKKVKTFADSLDSTETALPSILISLRDPGDRSVSKFDNFYYKLLPFCAQRSYLPFDRIRIGNSPYGNWYPLMIDQRYSHIFYLDLCSQAGLQRIPAPFDKHRFFWQQAAL